MNNAKITGKSFKPNNDFKKKIIEQNEASKEIYFPSQEKNFQCEIMKKELKQQAIQICKLPANSNSLITEVKKISEESCGISNPSELRNKDQNIRALSITETNIKKSEIKLPLDMLSSVRENSELNTAYIQTPLLVKDNKRKKLTILEQSKADWDSFKKEGIEYELKNHNKGKGGYLDKQLFLDRCRWRNFEREKSLILSRLNREREIRDKRQ